MNETILIVDDATFMRNIIRGILTANGYTVVGEASNGKEAYEKYTELKPDIVLMDITMPEINGIQGAQMITTAFPDAVIIMCSAMGQQAMVIDSIKAGAKDFIVKPFQPEIILKTLKKWGQSN